MFSRVPFLGAKMSRAQPETIFEIMGPKVGPQVQNLVPGTKTIKYAHRKTMPNPVLKSGNRAIWCKLWPETILGQTKPSQAPGGIILRAKVAVLLKLSPKMEPPRTLVRICRIKRILRKWDRTRCSGPRFHAPEARMTVVNQLPQTRVADG